MYNKVEVHTLHLVETVVFPPDKGDSQSVDSQTE